MASAAAKVYTSLPADERQEFRLPKLLKTHLNQAASMLGETVAQYLDHKLSSSFRDLGWRMFPANDGFDVERAFLASKFMELRYRWRVDRSGQVRAISERAQNLCS